MVREEPQSVYLASMKAKLGADWRKKAYNDERRQKPFLELPAQDAQEIC